MKNNPKSKNIRGNIQPLPDHVLAGIRRGQEDIKAGRSISFEEFKKLLNK